MKYQDFTTVICKIFVNNVKCIFCRLFVVLHSEP